jgi:hypothetical protein
VTSRGFVGPPFFGYTNSIGIWPLIVAEGMCCGWAILSKIREYNMISVIFQTYIGLLQVWAPKSLVTLQLSGHV